MASTIRFATRDDAPGLASVHVRSWQRAYRGIIEDDVLDQLSIPERTLRWEENLAGDGRSAATESPCSLVALVDGEVGGFASTGRFRDLPDRSDVGELWSLYVDPQWWGTGLADELMAAAAAQLRTMGFGRAYLWVFADNPRARRFYERNGWVSESGESAVGAPPQLPRQVRYGISL